MAQLARGGKPSRRVRRIVCPGVVLLVARVAQRAVQRVVIVDMAVGTLPRRYRMRAGQCESGGRVIELAVCPLHRIVAACARRGEAAVRNRTGRAAVVLLVTRVARGAGQVVVVVDVAVRTLPWRHRVRSRQSKSRTVVVKGRIQPRSRVVTGSAGLREIRRYVTRIRRALEIFQVTSHACRAAQVVVVIHVAVGALTRRHRVHARKWEVRRRMIKRRIRPRHRVVAESAGLRKACCHVIRIAGRLVVLGVAANACRTAEVVIVVDVAVGALPRRHRVPARQRKSYRAMIEVHIQPVVGPVATLTGRGKIRRDMVGIAGRLEFLQVARYARRGHGLKLAVGGPLVAGIAVHRRMRSSQGKAIDMLLNLLAGNLPAPHGVALLAIRPQLPPVNVRMAILASLSNVGEYLLDVALSATHRRVHATQGIARPVVIEFRDGTDRSPALRGMTVLAGDVQISVRTPRNPGVLRLRACQEGSQSEEQHRDRTNNSARPKHVLPLLGPQHHLQNSKKTDGKSRCNVRNEGTRPTRLAARTGTFLAVERFHCCL